MTTSHCSANPTLYDRWQSFCSNPQDQIVHKDEMLFIGSSCKIVIKCPSEFSKVRDLVVCGLVTLRPDQPYSQFAITNLYVLGGEVDCQGVNLIVNRIFQMTRPQFVGALSALHVQGSTFTPAAPRKSETAPSSFKTNNFKITSDTPLQNLHPYKGLRTAAKDGEEAFVKLLIAAHANLDEGGQTPLVLAAERNQVEVVDLLIKARALIDKADYTGSTPLLCAAANNAVGCAKLLMSAKADIHTQNFAQQTPLEAALSIGSLEILNMLLEAGADLNTTPPDANHMSAAMLHAAGNGLVQRFNDLLAQGFSIEATNGSYDTPLHIAAKYGQEQIVELLLEKNAAIETQGNQASALDLALVYNHRNVLKLLIAADPDAAIKKILTHPYPQSTAQFFFQLVPDPIAFGRSALQEAVRTLNAKAVRGLLVAGVGVAGDPVNKEEKAFGEELLLRAVLAADFEGVQLLISAKANFRSADAQGITLLMQARLQATGLEISKNATTYFRPNKLVRRQGNLQKIIELLLSFGAPDGLEEISVKKSPPSLKPKKTVDFAPEVTSQTTIDFANIATAKNNQEAFRALSELNILMTSRGYGFSCEEQLFMIESIKNNKQIDVDNANIICALSRNKTTNKNLPKKEYPQTRNRLKSAISEQKN